jgi:signal transduction histidine kinase
LLTQRGPLLLAARRTSSGAIVLGRFLDQDMRERIGAVSQVSFDLQPIQRSELGSSERALVDRVTAAVEPVVVERDAQVLSVYRALDDISTPTSLLLRVDEPRTISAHGERAVLYVQLTSVGVSLLILGLLLQLLQRIVIHPLGKLSSLALAIGRTDDTSARTGIRRSDEIGTLASEFDRMLEKLARARAETVDAARLAGRSEIATGVLHNVGNVLNSVNVSASLALRRAEGLATTDLERVTDVLRARRDDLGRFVSEDPKGRHLVPFLGELSGALSRQRGELVGELRSLGDGIEHMAELVRAQQSFAGVRGVVEPAELHAQLEAALRICASSAGSDDVRFERDFAELPPLLLDKHRLMEVLVNLVQNARQALADSNRADKRIVLSTRATDDGRLHILVEDNGVGIPSENLTKIFQHGFTTRKGGHGFGLHVSANAAAEMKGSLRAESAGLGRGATFTLDLPRVEAPLAMASAA